LKHLALSTLWTREVEAEHARLSTVSRKTLRIDRLAEYHAVAGAVADACWANRSKRRVSRARFGVWSRSTAAIDAFWAEVLRGRARDGTTGFDRPRQGFVTVLAYGDGKWGRGRAPHVRIRASADRTFRPAHVITTIEYDTTATCHVCGDVQQGVVDQHKNHMKGSPAGALENGLKHCARSTCSSFHDRDVNAALNILKALLAELRGEGRPTHLRRDSARQRPAMINIALRRGTSSSPLGAHAHYQCKSSRDAFVS
jgi:hypothetical protein